MNKVSNVSNVDLAPAAGQLADLVARVTDDELARPTPCPAYTLGDLIEHVGGLAVAFTAAARKDTGRRADRAPSGDASQLEPGWRERIPRDLAGLAEAWAEPGAWTGMTRIAGGEAPADVVGLSAADELVVHGWDLARATGQPYAGDPPALEAARGFLSMFASPDAPAGPDVPFGPARPLPADAPLLEQVLALAGRDLAWPGTPAPADVVRASVEAYMAFDRAAAEVLLAEDYVFTSPQDDHIGKAEFLERCFPTAGRLRSQQIVELVPVGQDAVFLMYEYELATGERYRNTEFSTVRGGQLTETQVFFGGRLRDEGRPA
jgi:uncharacterized protein (TIGR03086 family)